MATILITNPQDTIYYGVYLDNGVWTQGGYEGLATLSEIPQTAGEYEGSVSTDSTYSDSESVFDVTFTPTEEGIFKDSLVTDNNEKKINGKAYEEYSQKNKSLRWYK